MNHAYAQTDLITATTSDRPPVWDDLRHGFMNENVFDPAQRAAVAEVLNDDHVRLFNRFLSQGLLSKLYNRKATLDDVAVLDALLAQKQIATMPVLKTHPWLYPFLGAALHAPVTRSNAKGPYEVVFSVAETQEIGFPGPGGREVQAVMPLSLVLSFYNPEKKGHHRIRPLTHAPVVVEVSLKTASFFAGMPYMARQTRTVAKSGSLLDLSGGPQG